MKTQFCELTFLTGCIWGMCAPSEHTRNKRSSQMHSEVLFFYDLFFAGLRWGGVEEGGQAEIE